MNYEKKYKKALKRARIGLHDCNLLDCDDMTRRATITTIYNLFPELTESEDERIRKGIIRNLQYLMDRSEGFVKEDLQERIAWLEKQGEQKPTNKVEPKFHEGQWIVQENIGFYKVIEVCESWYEVIDIEDNHYSISFDKEYMCHLWTIQDAKDGDVLCYKDEISLYKHDIKNCTKQEITFGGFVYYCCYDGKRFITDSLYSLTEQDKMDIHPATEEQRDTLFAKMKEAGWEWNVEKKKLNKIKPIDKYEGLTDFERTLADICIGWIGEEPGWKQYIKDNTDILLKIAIKKFNSVQDAFFEPKPAYLEEFINELSKQFPDVSFAKLSRIAVRVAKWAKPTDEEMKELLRTEYEKGMADAIAEMQKPAWNGDDERILVDCFNILHRSDYPTYKVTKVVDWLKSLKNRYTWKPSDEQMKALHDLNLTGNISYTGQGQTLIELYNDLNGLTE